MPFMCRPVPVLPCIDYEDKGRKVRYDFTLPGGVSDNGGLD